MFIDFETYSECNLPLEGLYRYARHPSTRILCMAYAQDDDPVIVTTRTDVMRNKILNAVRNNQLIIAHNAAFERQIIWHVLQLPEVAIERFYCTMAQALANNLPGSLDKATVALGAKGKTGGSLNLIKACCTPPCDESRLPELHEYCANDLEITRKLHRFLVPMTQEELEEYWVSEHINDRGIPVDMPWVNNAATHVNRLKGDADQEIQARTGVPAGSPRLTKWFWQRVGPDGQECMAKDNKSGMSLDESARLGLLELPLPDDVMTVLELRHATAGGSTFKYKAIQDHQIDGRVHGCFRYAGAGQTGRFSGQVVQPHNFPRACAETPIQRPQEPTVKEAIAHLRPTVRSQQGLTWGDWSTIEAVVCPWLTGGHVYLVQEFEEGADLYESVAEALNVPRQVAKAVHLACQFGGAAGALRATSAIYRVEIDSPERYVNLWRRRNKWSVRFNQDLWTAFMRAFRNPNERFNVGRLRFYRTDDLIECELPSGRTLKYWNPMFDGDQMTAIKTYMGKSIRAKLWHGRLIENATQAVAADVLRDCLVRLDDRGAPVVMHCHDEIVVEGPCPYLKYEMEYRPTWAGSLPLRAEITESEYYLKV